MKIKVKPKSKHKRLWPQVMICLGLTLLVAGGALSVSFAKEAAVTKKTTAKVPISASISEPTEEMVSSLDTNQIAANYSVYTNNEYGFSFQYPTDLVINEWESSTEILFSISLTRPALEKSIPFQTPETSVSVLKKEKSDDLQNWLSNRTTIDGENTDVVNKEYGRYYWNPSELTKLTLDNKPAAIFTHEPFGLKIYDALIDQGSYIISIAFVDPTDTVDIKSDFLDIAASFKFTKDKQKVHLDNTLKKSLTENLNELQTSKLPKEISSSVMDSIDTTTIAGTQSVTYYGYKLPWENGISHKVMQDWNNTGGTHVGTQAYAYDFNTSEGEQIRASKAGTVGHVVSGNTLCGGLDYVSYANYVTLDHSDGKSTHYLHLQSVAVTVGQSVSQGQIIGYSGKTGYTKWSTSCYPHLHFQRQEAGGGFTQSVAVYFDEYPETELVYNSSYTSQNTGTCVPPSSGNWTISGSCTFTGGANAVGDVIIDNNATLTIASNGALNIDFVNHKLLVKNGSKVIIVNGGKIN